MTNGDLFQSIFDIYATELWSKPEAEFLEWLNSECKYPQPKTGHWIEHEIKGICRWLTCSVCGYEWVNKKENFCPNCGRVMIESQEGNDKG